MGDPAVLVIMGVSGSGKSTIGGALAARLGWAYGEADDFHSPANKAKMAAGVPLTDEDRAPWLAAIAGWIGERVARREPAVVTCSALRRAYRDLLRRPEVRFVHLRGAPALLAARLTGRRGHFFDPRLLESQLATLEEPGPDEGAVTVSIDATPGEIVEQILAAVRPGGAPAMSYVESLFSLAGQAVILTGGAGAIPSSLAVAFARAGAEVCLWGRGTNHPIGEAAERVRAEAGPGAGKVHAVKVDTATPGACEAALAETVAACGLPRVLVNGVGGNRGRSAFVDLDEATFEEVLRLNLLAGLVTPTRVLARRWIASGARGCVLNLASMVSYRALSGVWAYDAAKSGVLRLTEALARELAPHGIRVNAIAPGFFLGHQNRALLVDEKTGALTPRGQAIVDRTPFRRFGEMPELHGAALYLASERAAGFVTGICIPVDGGFLTDCI